MSIIDNARKLRTAMTKAGTRINWNGTVKKAAADLWDTAENTPDAAPDLWAGNR